MDGLFEKISYVMDSGQVTVAAAGIFAALNFLIQYLRDILDKRRERAARDIVTAALADADAAYSEADKPPITLMDLYQLIVRDIVEPIKRGEKSKFIDRWVLPCFWTIFGAAIPVAMSHFGIHI